MLDAHDLVWDIIDQDGPFDGVIGFSQVSASSLSAERVFWRYRRRAPRVVDFQLTAVFSRELA